MDGTRNIRRNVSTRHRQDSTTATIDRAYTQTHRRGTRDVPSWSGIQVKTRTTCEQWGTARITVLDRCKALSWSAGWWKTRRLGITRTPRTFVTRAKGSTGRQLQRFSTASRGTEARRRTEKVLYDHKGVYVSVTQRSRANRLPPHPNGRLGLLSWIEILISIVTQHWRHRCRYRPLDRLPQPSFSLFCPWIKDNAWPLYCFVLPNSHFKKTPV